MCISFFAMFAGVMRPRAAKKTAGKKDHDDQEGRDTVIRSYRYMGESHPRLDQYRGPTDSTVEVWKQKAAKQRQQIADAGVAHMRRAVPSEAKEQSCWNIDVVKAREGNLESLHFKAKNQACFDLSRQVRV